MELTRSVPPLLSEQRHRGSSDITSRGRATTTTATVSAATTTTFTTTRSKTTYNPVRSPVARYRQVAPVDTRIARGKLFSDDGEPRRASTTILTSDSFPAATRNRRVRRALRRNTHVRQREGLPAFSVAFRTQS